MKARILLFLALVLALVSLTGQPVDQPETTQAMKVRFEERAPFLVMGVETQNAMEGEAMMDVWTKFFSVSDKIPQPVGTCSYAIYYPGEKYDPASMQGFSYLVGLEVLDSVELPDGLQLHKIPGGDYAVFEYVGDINGIGSAYEYIFGEWLSAEKFGISPSEMFERYDERLQYDSPESLVEIWIPIVKTQLEPAPLEQEIKLIPPDEKLEQ